MQSSEVGSSHSPAIVYWIAMHSLSSNSNSDIPPFPPASSLPLIVVLIIIILVCFFIGVFTIYFFKSVMTNFLSTLQIRRSPLGSLVDTAGESMNPGLDPALVQSFPTFKYSTVKDFCQEKYGLECSICLVEFANYDLLCLLTICYHVFHQECIDLWLESHKTCPVCRSDLELPERSPQKSPMFVHSNSMHELGERNASLQDAISIEIKEANDDQEDKGREGGAPETSTNSKEHKAKREKFERFLRSHSTGHSIHSNYVEENKYTLRLLENVKLKINKRHNSTVSCITFGEFSSPITTKNRGPDDSAECSRGAINIV